jgi:hypothetical protein
MRPKLRRASVLVVTLLATLVGTARAQDPGSAAVGVPGLRIVTGQSPVIGGNAAGARERALDEAFRQAVDQALAELLDAPTRAAQVKSIKALEGHARSYVRRYRALEEGEANGTYTLKLEAEVDEPALRHAAERWGAPATGVGASAPVAPGFLVVVPSVAPVASAANGAAEIGPALLAALVNAGARAQLADPTTSPAAATAAAARATLPRIVFVAAEASTEGTVRGTAKLAVSCRLQARVVAAPSGLAVGELKVEPRAFADREDVARGQCFARAATELAARLAPAGAPATSGGGELRAVTVDVDVVEPAAVVALLRSARAIGAVSSADLRRVTPGHAELRLRTRGTAAALAPGLARDGSGVLDLSNVEVSGDLIRMRARLRPAAALASPTPTNP